MSWRRAIPEIAWAAFAAANLAVMFVVPHWQTIPFHFIWISLTILYGVRVWSWRPTLVVLSVVMVATAIGELHPGVGGETELPELAEVPLMGGVFLAMVWHARRRQIAMQAAARAAERERTFVRNASHQLRTPITVARGHAQLLRQSVDDDQELRDLDVVLDELGRLSTISDRLLMLAASTQEDFLVKQPARIDELVALTADRWRPCADRSWRTELAASVVARVDAARLTVALDALVENALNHTDAGDEITLAVRHCDGDVYVSVRNRTAARAAVAAEVSGAHRPERRGTGLGLPMVRAIADAHGGSTRIVSEPDVTTVEVRLPVD